MQPKHLLLNCSILAALYSAGAHAALITVTDGGDAGSATTCTLRQAIRSANADGGGNAACASGSGDDTIVFANALRNATITLDGSELLITSPLTISGSGQTISANRASRVLHVDGSASPFDLVVSNVTLADGRVQGDGTAGSGGGIHVTQANLTLNQSTVSGNYARYDGAGVFATGSASVVLKDSLVTGNSAGYHGGGIYGYKVTLQRSTVSYNTAANGAGVYLLHDDVLIQGSTIACNTASCVAGNCAGGGYVAFPATFTLVDSVISYNVANGDYDTVAGGLRLYGGNPTIANTTVYDNTAYGRYRVAGGVQFGRPQGDTTSQLTLTNASIYKNSASTSTNYAAGGLMIGTPGRLTGSAAVVNSVIAGNLSNNEPDLMLDRGADATVRFSMLGAALSSGQFSDPSAFNIFSDTPELQPLHNNGGPTQTLAPAPSSRLLGAGNPALATFGGVPLQFDQRGRGFSRVFRGQIDIGAYQTQDDRIFADAFDDGP